MKSISSKVSAVLRDLRKRRNVTLETASKMTGVSKTMLGQIEREESSPTIAVLWKIASGFDVPFSSFVYEKVKKHKTTRVIHPSDSKIKVMTLFPYDPTLKFETFILDLLPGLNHHSEPHSKGVREHVVVVKGEMEVLVKGKWRLLKEREGISFDASFAHGYRNRSLEPATIHNIIHYS